MNAQIQKPDNMLNQLQKMEFQSDHQSKAPHNISNVVLYFEGWSDMTMNMLHLLVEEFIPAEGSLLFFLLKKPEPSKDNYYLKFLEEKYKRVSWHIQDNTGIDDSTINTFIKSKSIQFISVI